MNKHHYNVRFPQYKNLNQKITVTTDVKEALKDADMILNVTKSEDITAFLTKYADIIPRDIPFVSCSKGETSLALWLFGSLALCPLAL